MPNPEFTSIDVFIKRSLAEAPISLSEQSRHDWTFLQFLEHGNVEYSGKKQSGWQKANRGDVEDRLTKRDISKLTSFAQEITGNKEISLIESIDQTLAFARNSQCRSLDAKVYTMNGQLIGRKGDFLIDTHTPTVHQETCDNYINEKFQQLASSCLSSLEMQVLELRQDGVIQKDIAKQLGLRSKAAVANLERKAIWKLRDDLSMKQLFDKTN